MHEPRAVMLVLESGRWWRLGVGGGVEVAVDGLAGDVEGFGEIVNGLVRQPQCVILGGVS